MHAITAHGRIDPVIPKPFNPSSVSTSTKTNIQLSIDLPMFGRSISCRWREAEIDPIFIRHSVPRADEELRAPRRPPVIVYDEPLGKNAPREDRHVEERADRTHCGHVRGGPGAGAGPSGWRRSRARRAGRSV